MYCSQSQLKSQPFNTGKCRKEWKREEVKELWASELCETFDYENSF